MQEQKKKGQNGRKSGINGKLIYGYNQCAFKMNQIINFRTHYFKEHKVNIPMKSGRAYYIKEAGQNLNDIMKLYSTIEL